MLDTAHLDLNNLKYVLETDFFEDGEEFTTFFRWATHLNQFNFIANEKNVMINIDSLGEYGKMEQEKAVKFIEKLKEHGLLIEITMPDNAYYMINPSLAVSKNIYENWVHIFVHDFSELEENGVLKDIPDSYWEETSEEEGE
ncbi:hypothetical protein [Bacillus cereus]|uniref:hypothetical protein n=1 Tax=Bacillus cereus TaxID=1396 RepID=UPI000BEB6837|nr:hypothetical protein [Bacillus cereus]PDY82758.1 hypothetical protein CON06_10160 [Bacillus cereus]